MTFLTVVLKLHMQYPAERLQTQKILDDCKPSGILVQPSGTIEKPAEFLHDPAERLHDPQEFFHDSQEIVKLSGNGESPFQEKFTIDMSYFTIACGSSNISAGFSIVPLGI